VSEATWESSKRTQPRTDIFLLKLARLVALHKSRLAHTAITHKNQLEFGDILLSALRGSRRLRARCTECEAAL
jgi:hypothetical protein